MRKIQKIHKRKKERKKERKLYEREKYKQIYN